MVADKQTDTKVPPPKVGDDTKAVQTLHGQVHEIQANGNVKPSAAEVAKGNAAADQHYGSVAIVHGKDDHPAAGKPENAAKPEASKTEPPKSTGMWGWASSMVDSAQHIGSNVVQGAEHLATKAENLGSQAITGAEHLGEAALKKGSDVAKAAGNEYHEAKNYVGNKIGQAEHAVSAAVHSDTVHNLEDVGKTLAQGVGDSATKLWHGAEHGVEAAGKGIKDAAVWAEHNPGKAALVVGGAVVVGAAVVAAEVATGGMATAGIGAASAWLTSGAAAGAFETLGFVAAGAATTKAAIDVGRHGEIGTLMNQQHESPEKVAAARKALKQDTGDALLGDAMLGVGQGIKYGAKGLAALRAGSTAESTAAVGETATAARAGETAGAARTGEAAGTAGHAPEGSAPLAEGDNPLMTRVENAAEHVAEEVADAGATTASAFAMLMDKCRQIASVGGTAYQHYSDANNVAGTVKSTIGIAKGVYAVAAPDNHDVTPQSAKASGNNGGAGVPDEPTKH